ncbi:MAG: bifunctional precorrin-2 dehydrogenase/sirohydrochlorin ferrochelatase [Myxococcales bacterium]|nr:bifunctional precorrin-2 dehydrogenase/sirohydrochlorin ferrochelatase [Myxococcales bacterium]MCB9575888.1 bifunctional precorrin-2 dehydrogenase/sirohydrochlorin ferrochelatase [Polyangiaceae bacterium]
MSSTFLVGLLLQGRSVLIVGSGAEAARRARTLADVGAQVTVLAPTPGAELSTLAASGSVHVERRPYHDGDTDGRWLVVLAERDAELARRVGAACEQARIFYCAVDQPEHNTFAHVAVVHSGPISVGISSSGRAPALIRKLAEELSRMLAASDFGAWAARVAALRDRTPRDERRAVLSHAVRDLHFDGKLVVPPLDD